MKLRKSDDITPQGEVAINLPIGSNPRFFTHDGEGDHLWYEADEFAIKHVDYTFFFVYRDESLPSLADFEYFGMFKPNKTCAVYKKKTLG